MIRRFIKWGGLGVLGFLVLAQAVPYGRSHTNPPVTKEPAWDSAATRTQAVKSCFDCHSNKTTWPWYSNVAPMSWLVQSDVDGGRNILNFSEWDKPQEGRDAADVVRAEEMPPLQYTLIHRGAKMSDAEREAFVRGLEATLAASPSVPGGREGDK